MIQEAGTLFRKDRARRGRFDRLPLAPLRRNCGHIAEKLLPLAKRLPPLKQETE